MLVTVKLPPTLFYIELGMLLKISDEAVLWDYRFQYSSVAPSNISEIFVLSLNWLFFKPNFLLLLYLNIFFCTTFFVKWLFCTHFISQNNHLFYSFSFPYQSMTPDKRYPYQLKICFTPSPVYIFKKI